MVDFQNTENEAMTVGLTTQSHFKLNSMDSRVAHNPDGRGLAQLCSFSFSPFTVLGLAKFLRFSSHLRSEATLPCPGSSWIQLASTEWQHPMKGRLCMACDDFCTHSVLLQL